MMKQALFFVLASLLSSIVSAQNECCLCDGCYGVHSSKFDFELYSSHFKKQMSCVSLDWELTDNVAKGSGVCNAEIAQWRGCCCSAGNSNGCNSLERQPTEPPRVNLPAGNYPYCDLCKNKQFPLNPYNVATIASVPGNPTCGDLYWMGRSNNIPASICYPIQNFLEDSCGCLPANGPTPNPPTPRPPTPSPPSPANPPFRGPKDKIRTTKDNLRIGVVGRARGESETR